MIAQVLIFRVLKLNIHSKKKFKTAALQEESKIWIHPFNVSMVVDIIMKLRPPLWEIKVAFLVTIKTLSIPQNRMFVFYLLFLKKRRWQCLLFLKVLIKGDEHVK